MRTVFAWCVRRVRFASRCDGGRSSRPHHCAAFAKCYTMMRSNSPSAATTTHEPHASLTHTHHANTVRMARATRA
eukprot:8696222-Lingulodinium_polyedra.AAC.1